MSRRRRRCAAVLQQVRGRAGRWLQQPARRDTGRRADRRVAARCDSRQNAQRRAIAKRYNETQAAVALVTGRPGAAFLGGGTNLVDHMKLGIATPEMLVDVTGLPFGAVEQREDGGVRIGAAVRNSDLAADPLIRSAIRCCREALLAGASGQLRNLATTGGNLLQRTRCVYFQDRTTPCNKRAPGIRLLGASAATPARKAIFGASRALHRHPSVGHGGGPGGARRRGAGAAARTASARHPDRRAAPAARRRARARHHAGPRRAHHRRRAPAARGRPLGLPQGPRPGLLRVRAGLRRRRPRCRRAARSRDVGIALGGVAHKPWRATRGRGARCAAARPPRTRSARRPRPSSTRPRRPRDNAFKVPLARNTIVAVLRDLSDRR